MRGDSVSITGADFLKPPALEPLPEIPIWKQDWVFNVLKQVLGGAFALFILFGVIRPAVKSLIAKPLHLTVEGAGTSPGAVAVLADGSVAPGRALGAAALPAGQQAADGAAQLPHLPAMNEIEQVKQFVSQDPKVAAQVIKGWVGD